jgi:hypothetical protein
MQVSFLPPASFNGEKFAGFRLFRDFFLLDCGREDWRRARPDYTFDPFSEKKYRRVDFSVSPSSEDGRMTIVLKHAFLHIFEVFCLYTGRNPHWDCTVLREAYVYYLVMPLNDFQYDFDGTKYFKQIFNTVRRERCQLDHFQKIRQMISFAPDR